MAGITKTVACLAERLASLAGVPLGQPIYISEGLVYVPREYAAEAMPQVVGVETLITPVETKIILNIQVAYAIQ